MGLRTSILGNLAPLHPIGSSVGNYVRHTMNSKFGKRYHSAGSLWSGEKASEAVR